MRLISEESATQTRLTLYNILLGYSVDSADKQINLRSSKAILPNSQVYLFSHHTRTDNDMHILPIQVCDFSNAARVKYLLQHKSYKTDEAQFVAVRGRNVFIIAAESPRPIIDHICNQKAG